MASVYCCRLGDPVVDADYDQKVAQVEEALKRRELYSLVDDVLYTVDTLDVQDPDDDKSCDTGQMRHDNQCGESSHSTSSG